MLYCVARRVRINWLSVANNLSRATLRLRRKKTMRENFVVLSAIVSAIVLATLVTQGDCQHGHLIVDPPPPLLPHSTRSPPEPRPLLLVDPPLPPAPRPARSTVEARPPPLIAVDPPRPRPNILPPPFIAVDPPRPQARLQRSPFPTTHRPTFTVGPVRPSTPYIAVDPPRPSIDRRTRSANSPPARPIAPLIAVDPPRRPSIAIDPPRPGTPRPRRTTNAPPPQQPPRVPLTRPAPIPAHLRPNRAALDPVMSTSVNPPYTPPPRPLRYRRSLPRIPPTEKPRIVCADSGHTTSGCGLVR